MSTKPYKAVAAFVLSFLSALLVSISGATEFTDLTPLQWMTAIIAAVVTAGGVYVVTNPPTDA